MNTSTLPIFRVAGLSETASRQNATQTAENVKQRFQAAPPELAAFSTTVYVVHQYLDDNQVKIVAGKLVSTDFELPENADDVWIAPQNYAVLESWQDLSALPDLPRSFRVDFETYPAFGSPKVYVGLLGDVEMHEEDLPEET